MRVVAALFIGLLFGCGLVVSGMANPQKIINFLDIAGNWDPTLLLVMVGALAVTLVGYRIVLRRPHPLFEAVFQVPTKTNIDLPLVGGAALFGIGWGLSGFCPGPALTAATVGGSNVLMFLGAMVLGLASGRLLGR
jgi:uncharacterized membrane protein YedE/YeeE